MKRPRRWTEQWARRQTLKHVNKIKASLIEIGGIWGDVDEYLVGRADELRELADDFLTEMREQIAARREETEQ